MPDDKPVSRIRERTGIHVYSAEKPDIPGADFRSFSDGCFPPAAHGRGKIMLLSNLFCFSVIPPTH